MIAQTLHLLEGGTGMVARRRLQREMLAARMRTLQSRAHAELNGRIINRGEIPTHLAADASEWLASNPPPRNSARSIEEIECQIASDREDGD